VADLPWANWAVQVRLHARRFFCDNRGCPRAIFTERLPTVVVPYGRKTLRLVALLTAIGFALGGEAGKRMSQQVGLSSSADTLLAQIRATPLARVSTPRVLGVDDFSFRRGQVFGTILVDLERRKPIDLLPDREAATLASWLRAHPGVKIISRDRGGSYAEGARQGAPEAHQVADRFHLLLNLSEALEGFFLHKKGALKEALHDPTVPAVETAPRQPWHEGKTSTWEATSLCRHQAVVERYHRIHDLAAKRVDSANIARQMGASRRTIYRYLQMDQPPERKQPRPRRGRPHLVEPYKGYLLRRWNEGCRNASLLWREIQAQGYTASLANVGRLLAPLRLHHGKFKAVAAAQCPLPVEAVKKPRPRTALQVARLLTRSPEQRSRDDIAFLRRLCQEDAGIAQTTELVQAFCTILRTRQGDHLDHWLAQVQEQGIPELRSFAQGLRKDYDAVKAGLSLEWSQGQVEGQVHRLKLLKRQMYGRASFPTLRQRVLRRA
jgi:transposase